jgi:hypothetical protein
MYFVRWCSVLTVGESYELIHSACHTQIFASGSFQSVDLLELIALANMFAAGYYHSVLLFATPYAP